MMKISRLKVHIMKASWLNYLHKSIYICLVLARTPQHKIMSDTQGGARNVIPLIVHVTL